VPAVSKNQRRAAGIALAVKKGEIPMDSLQGASLQMWRSMTMEELEHYAGTKEKGLPEKKKKK